MTLNRAKNRIPSNYSDAQDHLKWVQAYANENQQHKNSLFEGIKLGMVSHIRLDEILDRNEIRQIQMVQNQYKSTEPNSMKKGIERRKLSHASSSVFENKDKIIQSDSKPIPISISSHNFKKMFFTIRNPTRQIYWSSNMITFRTPSARSV